MFQVSTAKLSPDLATAGVGYDENDLGELTPAALQSLLERFRAIDSLQNAEADPHLVITAAAGRFVVRTGQGKLFLYNARDITEPYVELSAEQIIEHLGRAPAAAAMVATEAPPLSTPAPHRGIAVAILIAGLALNGYTLYSAFYTESVNEKTTVTLLTDSTELAARQRDVVGTYATGAQPGDRVIVVGADGRVEFAEIGAKRSINNGTDTYRLGRREKKLCLTTIDSGVIDIVNIDTLVYFRDTYKRTK